MDPSLALYTSYRRALHQRYALLTARYTQLPNGGRQSDDYHYTEEAKDIFPRYNVVEAVIDSIEELDSDALAPLQHLREELEVRTTLGDSVFTQRRGDAAITRAQNDERKQLLELLNSIDPASPHRCAPLPYRRVLESKERDHLYAQLRDRWGVQQTNWHPMIHSDVPDSVLVVDAKAIWSLAHQRPGFMATWLIGIAAPRIYELREFGPSAMIDAGEFVPTYNGAEGFWFDSSLDWLVYASHEGSVSFDGTIRSSISTLWPESTSSPWEMFISPPVPER